MPPPTQTRPPRSPANRNEHQGGDLDATDVALDAMRNSIADVSGEKLLEAAHFLDASPHKDIKADAYTRVLEAQKSLEEHRGTLFIQVTQAATEAKNQSPEIYERRLQARTRANLGVLVGVGGIGALGSTAQLVISGGNLLGIGLMSGLTVLLMTYAAILASGGVLTARSVLSLIRQASRFSAGKGD
jgi:hypothetical protein